jgi:hypothetical protein
MPEKLESEPRSKPLAFGAGALIGTLGGLIGLGGAEFRLPVLIGLFRFRGLEAVILNKATSLVVVATALPFRASTVPFSALGASWPIMVNLLAGSLAGAWVGAGWATRLKSETLHRVIAVLLVLIAGILLFAHDTVEKTFLHNHADGIASMDLFVVPTISFRLLYGLLILDHDRRQILWLGVTAHPTAEWISHQLTEAYGWKVAPRYIIRDRDAVYGDVFIRRLPAMSIRDRPTAPRSPWQNGYCERAIGSIRRECLDHVVVFGERHLRHLLRSYASYYNRASERPSVYVVEEKRLC